MRLAFPPGNAKRVENVRLVPFDCSVYIKGCDEPLGAHRHPRDAAMRRAMYALIEATVIFRDLPSLNISSSRAVISSYNLVLPQSSM
jgi:hypothetical protein